MDQLRGLPREQKLFGVAAAEAVFLVALLFLKWFGAGGFSFKATEIDSWWIALVLAVAAGVIFLAEAANYPLPIKAGLGVGALSATLVFFWTLTHYLDGDGQKIGAWVGIFASLVGAGLAWMIWREERT